MSKEEIFKKEQELVIARLEIMSNELHFSSGNSSTLSRDEMIKCIKNNDEIGLEFVKTEIEFLQAIKNGELMKVLLS